MVWWLKCIPCGRVFGTPGRLVDHGVREHGASRGTLQRAVGQAWGGRIALVETEGGRLMVMMQPPLL
jgi:hypothetical protein